MYVFLCEHQNCQFIVLILRVPMDSYYKQLAWAHVEGGNKEFKQQFPYSYFHDAWLSFLKLLDIDYQEGYKCFTCGINPQKIVMDGIHLGINKNKLPKRETTESGDKLLEGR